MIRRPSFLSSLCDLCVVFFRLLFISELVLMSVSVSRNDDDDGQVFQLSGFSDPVYAEAYIYVHQYDIMLDGTHNTERERCRVVPFDKILLVDLFISHFIAH